MSNTAPHPTQPVKSIFKSDTGTPSKETLTAIWIKLINSAERGFAGGEKTDDKSPRK